MGASVASRQRKPALSRLHKPDHLTLEEWQVELRRQFGRQQEFQLVNRGDHPVFSQFEVTNPASRNTYRVQIRGPQVGDNACSCPDFATSALGTCKHIEFTLAKLERRRKLAAQLLAGFQPEYSEVLLQYGARRDVRWRPGTECPAALVRVSQKFFDDESVLRPETAGKFEEFLNEAGRLGHELRCADDVLAYLAELRDGESRRARLTAAFPRGIRSAGFKNLLRTPLYDYQREGALFAARAGRALIGDEMGLGKTVQALAVAEIMARHLGVERVLVVCPTSLKHQWEREIERFSDRTATVIGGLRVQREAGFRSESFFKIMNYDTVHADLGFIVSWGPDLVILDEAQRIKNWSTRLARNVKKISSPYALVLTGTPLENRLEELISIVQFVDRYRLGPTFRLLHDHQVRDENGKVVGYRDLDQLGLSLAPILLRRHKEQVLEQLPERIDTNVFVPMTEQQREHHEENKEIVAKIVAKWRRFRFLSEADQRRLMICLQNMRMSCDSTFLLDQNTDHGLKADEAVTLLAELIERPDAKAVVFSQWLRMHEVLQRRLRCRRWDYVLFHGGVPGKKRGELIDRFRDDPNCRLFLSTDAGGVGLNLQHAAVVMNMDLPWNPAVLEQRIGRVHRLGQKQPVRVVNFVARGTIEEGMLSVLQFKKSLFAGVLDGGAKDIFMGGSRLTKFMETVEATTTAIPASADEMSDASAAIREERPVKQTANTKAEPSNPWEGLLQAGLGLVQQLAGSARESNGSKSSLVRRDPTTGEQYLRFPVPPPEVLDKALESVQALLAAFGGRR